ncbi:MAG: polymer-forming cytoskeletal protein [Deltaproteobacteria bacterium]|nr:polymer-forming cytoskeletal protein [Deltaproteobacteria bacterium]
MVEEMGGFPKDVNAFIGKNSEFVGKLTFDGTVRIDGKVEGEIFSKGTLIIGPGAQIEATVNVDVVIISGNLHGDVNAKKRIEMRAPGKLYGNIATPQLVVEQGVIFEGNCRMENVASEAAKDEKPAAKPAPAAPAQGTLGSIKGGDHKD